MKMSWNDANTWLGHSISLGAILMTLAGLLPAAAALVAIIWYAIQIYESVTVQRWLKNRRLKALVVLRAKSVALELRIRQANTGLGELQLANKVHLAAETASAAITTEHVEAAAEADRIKAIANVDLVKSQKHTADLDPSI
jgi:chromate transport protein ChrA